MHQASCIIIIIIILIIIIITSSSSIIIHHLYHPHPSSIIHRFPTFFEAPKKRAPPNLFHFISMVQWFTFIFPLKTYLSETNPTFPPPRNVIELGYIPTVSG